MNKEICILNGTKWILGDESTEPMNWEDANNWCKSIGQDLPPREVLLMAFLNPEIRSKFANDYYWSSSEFDSNGAWGQDFNDGIQFDGDKYFALPVRAVRAIIAEASEQTEQEPVATKLESHQFTAFHVSADDFKKLQKLPTGTKIYTAPPKREPLSEDEVRDGLDGKNGFENWYDDRFVDGVRFAEKHHGIGGGE